MLLHQTHYLYEKSRSNYIRDLIDGYQPAEFPPADYIEVLSELKRIGINMNQIAGKAHSLNFVDEPEYRRNVHSGNVLQFTGRRSGCVLQNDPRPGKPGNRTSGLRYRIRLHRSAGTADFSAA